MRDHALVSDGVDLYWIPLGAGPGGALVRWSGRLYESVVARRDRRHVQPLYHSALMITLHASSTAIEMAQWADDKGCATLGISEHHCAADGYIPSPLVLAAAMAAVTKNARIFIGAALLPMYDPVRLAEGRASRAPSPGSTACPHS